MTVPPVYPSPIRTIPLTQGKVAIVDAADYEWLRQYHWYYCQGYAVCAIPHSGRGGGHYRMHRLIMGNPHGVEVDHRNRDKLDNRRGNLRCATHADNQHNAGLRVNNRSGYKGVSKRVTRTGRVRWWARIIVNTRHINLGRYDTPEEAALAYNDAAREYFGEFAALNDIATPCSSTEGVA